MCTRGLISQRGWKHTLIIAKRAQTEPKTALAGVMLATSFARLRASIDTFNTERMPSPPSGCGDSVYIVESRMEATGHTGRGEKPEP